MLGHSRFISHNIFHNSHFCKKHPGTGDAAGARDTDQASKPASAEHF